MQTRNSHQLQSQLHHPLSLELRIRGKRRNSELVSSPAMTIEKFDLKSAEFLYDVGTRIKYSNFIICYQVRTQIKTNSELASTLVSASSSCLLNSDSRQKELGTRIKYNNLLFFCQVEIQIKRNSELA